MDFTRFREAATESCAALSESPDVCASVQSAADLSRNRVEQLLGPPKNEIRRLLTFGEATFLRNLPQIVRLSLESDDNVSEQVWKDVRAFVEKSLLGNPRILYTGSHTQDVIRFRKLLQLWMSPREYRDMIVGSMTYHIDKNTVGPLNDGSLFLAMEYPSLLAEYSGDTELEESIMTLVNHFDRWVALYAFTPPEHVKGAQVSRAFPGTDDVLESDKVTSRKRADVRYTVCAPQAEAGHLETSLSSKRGNNTFVYCDGHLVGSLKHNDDSDSRYTMQNTFLGLRTVRAPDGTYPVVEGGLYLVADASSLHRIKCADDRCDLPSLQLMPQRSAGTNFVPPEDFARRTRSLRRKLEDTP